MLTKTWFETWNEDLSEPETPTITELKQNDCFSNLEELQLRMNAASGENFSYDEAYCVMWGMTIAYERFATLARQEMEKQDG